MLVNGSLFSVFSFFNQGVAFLLLIILANYIAPDEYGQLSMFNTIVSFLTYFIALSTQGYFSVSYFKRDREGFREDFTGIITFLCICTLVIGLLFFCFRHTISRLSSISETFLLFTIVISFFLVFYNLYLDYERVRERIGSYGIWSCSYAIISFVLSLLFVVGMKMNWYGRVYAFLLCAILFGISTFILLCKNKLFIRRINIERIKYILLWGIPLIPHQASVWVKQGGDRFIINSFHSLGDVGLFSFALNLTSVIIMVGSAFNSTNSVSIYQVLSSDKGQEEKAKALRRQRKNIFMLISAAYIILVVGLSIFVPIVLPRYTASLPYFLLLSIQGLGQCIYFLFCNYLFYYHKTVQLMYITFGTSVLHFLLSLWLTRYSLTYTCVVYIVSQILMVALVAYVSMKVLNKELSNNQNQSI